ncbi:MAG: hypothetical protein P857_767, partial [Candidatus Xenolissoclinum pacificiensis L6]
MPKNPPTNKIHSELQMIRELKKLSTSYQYKGSSLHELFSMQKRVTDLLFNTVMPNMIRLVCQEKTKTLIYNPITKENDISFYHANDFWIKSIEEIFASLVKPIKMSREINLFLEKYHLSNFLSKCDDGTIFNDYACLHTWISTILYHTSDNRGLYMSHLQRFLISTMMLHIASEINTNMSCRMYVQVATILSTEYPFTEDFTEYDDRTTPIEEFLSQFTKKLSQSTTEKVLSLKEYIHQCQERATYCPEYSEYVQYLKYLKIQDSTPEAINYLQKHDHILQDLQEYLLLQNKATIKYLLQFTSYERYVQKTEECLAKLKNQVSRIQCFMQSATQDYVDFFTKLETQVSQVIEIAQDRINKINDKDHLTQINHIIDSFREMLDIHTTLIT